MIARDSAASGVRTFLSRLSAELFRVPPGPNLVLRLTRIAIFAPPQLRIAGASQRFGIATVETVAELVQVTSDGERVLAAGRASGVIQEIPYGATGPLTAGVLEDGTGLDVRWGTIAAAGDISFGGAPRSAGAAGWPWRSLARHLIRDADLDGTADDTDADGTADLDEWLALPDATLSDPWYRLLAGGQIAAAPAGGQPYPFDPAAIPGTYDTDADRSALFQTVPGAVSALPDAPLFRAAASDGGPEAHLFLYAPGTSPPLFRERDGIATSFEDATRGQEGLFYFDTTDALAPHDADGDGTIENLTPAIVVSDPGWWARGCLFVNASSFSLADSSRDDRVEIAPPGEPCADLDADGACEEGEPFLALGYPADPLAPGSSFARLGVAPASAATPRRVSGPQVAAPGSFSGLILLTGRWEGASNARVFGAIAAAGSVRVPPTAGGERLQVLFDSRMARDLWPPANARLPRTVWQRRSVAP